MRIEHTLWKVNNGWLLVPENTHYLKADEGQQCYIFKTLKEFAEWKPKRQRKPRIKTVDAKKSVTVPVKPEDITHAN